MVRARREDGHGGCVRQRSRSRPRLLAALGVLVAVEAFELSDGFGVMANVVDPVDLWANAVGIALAVAVDVLTARVLRRRPREASTDPQAR